MDENSNFLESNDHSRIEKLEREYEETLRKELNILNEEEFWNLESAALWQYIQYLEREIKNISKDIICEAKKLNSSSAAL